MANSLYTVEGVAYHVYEDEHYLYGLSFTEIRRLLQNMHSLDIDLPLLNEQLETVRANKD